MTTGRINQVATVPSPPQWRGNPDPDADARAGELGGRGTVARSAGDALSGAAQPAIHLPPQCSQATAR